MCQLLNTRDHYVEVQTIDLLSVANSAKITDAATLADSAALDTVIRNSITSILTGITGYVDGSWNGQYQLSGEYSDGVLTAASGGFSFKKAFTAAELSADDAVKFHAEYESRFGWHNLDGDDDVPDTLSRSANEFFPTITTFQDNNGVMRFDRDHMKKIGVVVYKMFVDPSENNKVNFEPVEAYAGSLGRNDKDPTTGVTTFIDTIINSQSRYINFFSNCFNTPVGKKYYNDELDMFVV